MGLRPRSGLLTLAGIAATLGLLLGLAPDCAEWLSDQLASGFSGERADIEWELAAGAGAALLALFAGLTVAIVTVGSLARARRALAVAPASERSPAAITAMLTLVAVAVIVGQGTGLPAGAARAVDASTNALWIVWLAWIRRGLFALAGVAAGVGLIERRVAARRLWHGLHQTPAQARREAQMARRR